LKNGSPAGENLPDEDTYKYVRSKVYTSIECINTTAIVFETLKYGPNPEYLS
jgi:hypothetical protein